MNYSSVNQIAQAANKTASELLLDLQESFGKDFPQIYSWTESTPIPDDLLSSKIWEIYYLKNEISGLQKEVGDLATILKSSFSGFFN